MKLSKKSLGLLVIPAIVGVGVLNISKQLNFIEIDNPYIGYSRTADPLVVIPAFVSEDSFSFKVTLFDDRDNSFEANYAADAEANPPYNSTISAGFSTPGIDGLYDTADDGYFETAPGGIYILRASSRPEYDRQSQFYTAQGEYVFGVKPEVLEANPSPSYRLESITGLGVAVGGTAKPIVDTVYFAETQDDPAIISRDDTMFAFPETRTFTLAQSGDYTQTIDPSSPIEISDPYLRMVEDVHNFGDGVPAWEVDLTLNVQNWYHSVTGVTSHFTVGLMRWDTDPDEVKYFNLEPTIPTFGTHIEGDEYVISIMYPARYVAPGKYTLISLNDTGIMIDGSTDENSMFQLGLIDPADLAPFGVTQYPASASLGYPIEDFTFMIPKMY